MFGYSPPKLNAWTIRGSALLPSLNSSNVNLSSWFLSIWSKILSTRFCGVLSSSVAAGCCPCFIQIIKYLSFFDEHKLN